MGRKRNGTGYLDYICIAGLIGFFLWGCADVKYSRHVSASIRDLPEALPAEPKPETRTVVQPSEEKATPPILQSKISEEKTTPPVLQSKISEEKATSSVLQSKAPEEKTPPPVLQNKVPEENINPPDPVYANLKQAKNLFAHRDYDGSLKICQKILSVTGKTPPGDEALYNMALIYAHAENGNRDYSKSLLCLERLLKEYPKSPLAVEAKIWVALLQENKDLRQMIEKTNQIDIAIDEKKREKGR